MVPLKKRPRVAVPKRFKYEYSLPRGSGFSAGNDTTNRARRSCTRYWTRGTSHRRVVLAELDCCSFVSDAPPSRTRARSACLWRHGGGAHAAYGRAAPPPVARPRARGNCQPGEISHTKLYETRAPKPAVIPAGASRGEVRYQLLYCHSCLSRFRFTGTLCLVAVPAPERPFYHGKLDGVGDLA